ncbi:MAG: M20/M25/M40 family metallo-hydrolase [Gemmatimonadota bacterium]|nr:M20/M25/M40 family metallo-hydrolase [Gemmatimonadota bacterium]
MRATPLFAAAIGAALFVTSPRSVRAQQESAAAPANDPVATLIGRLTLDHYKADIKGLTNFGDRRQGTKRNREAVDWIESQLKSYGCTDVERLTYTYAPPPPRGRGAFRGRGRGGAPPEWAAGGGRYRGIRARTGVNNDSLRQPNLAIRHEDAEASTPGERQEVYCTKIGTKHPDEMYIVGGHMDGIGWGQAANDDGSGSALVMQLARIFSMPDVQTDVSIRFILWNNEETGLNGSRAYVAQREALQGKEDPPGSGKYPEPKWLGMIQHDMMLWDHGMPRADGTVSREQRPEADVNIEYQSRSTMADSSQKLAWIFERANEQYATDYPAAVGPHMTNTDSDPFKDICPTISLRENFRGTQIGAGWDPNWHQPTDVYTTYHDKDFLLGLNAAQTTLAAVAELTGTTLKQ